MQPSTLRRRLLVSGQVQGVGFRPFVYRLALRLGLGGSVGNTSDGVCIDVQGDPEAVEAFCRELPATLPPLARITRLHIEDTPPQEAVASFRIVASTGHSGHTVLVSPDVATCAECEADMRDPHNRRYRYPFTNCTNCGPRYTITRAIPYDRATTSMACFPQCPQCQAEYDDPLERRFHAQPNACPVCGPRVWAVAARGPEDVFAEAAATALSSPAPEGTAGAAATGEAALYAVARMLRDGGIAAVKGLGGFHLVCDALQGAAVEELRRRKQRPHKPLAVMVRDVATARLFAHVGEGEARVLASPERPIVLCQRRADGALPAVLAPTLAPDTPTIGLVLPYTPLHMVLFDICADVFPGPVALVMTSGNAGGEPICLGNREALRRLADIADIFLLHNRDILVRADDSVTALVPVASDFPETKVFEGERGEFGRGEGEPFSKRVPLPPPTISSSPPASTIFYRRARGYVPRPVALAGVGPCVLGTGPELKTTLCLTRGDAAFVSQHIGDMQNLETLGFYEEVAAHLEKLLEVRPEAVACDLHPDFMTTAFGEALAQERGIPLLRLQHHFAHAWSVLAEHGHSGPALALTLDGTGLGEDGDVWGGELLLVDTLTLEQRRLGRLRPFPLPGGEAAIREPWRIAQGLLTTLGLEAGPWADNWPQVEERAVGAVTEMTRRQVNCIATSSAGRLFDAVGALLGLCSRTSYEGQAAIRLEAAQGGAFWRSGIGCVEGYAAEVAQRGELWELDSWALFAAVAQDWRAARAAGHRQPGRMARAFHVGLAQGLARMAEAAAGQTGLRTVALSGGVMQNATLAVVLPQALRERGLRVLLHRDIPANDGGVSLGQAAWARAVLARG